MFIVTFKRSIYKEKMSSLGAYSMSGIVLSTLQESSRQIHHFVWIYAIVSLLITPVFSRFALQLFFHTET